MEGMEVERMGGWEERRERKSIPMESKKTSLCWKSALGGMGLGLGLELGLLGLGGSCDLWGLGGREMMEVAVVLALEEREGNEMSFFRRSGMGGFGRCFVVVVVGYKRWWWWWW